MLRVRAVQDVRALVVVVLMAGLGVVFALMIERFGTLAPVVIVFILASVFVLPWLSGQAVRRFRVLRGQITWWHGLWLLVFFSGLQFRFRDTQVITETAVDSWAAYRIALMAMTALALGTHLVLRRVAIVASLF